MTEAFIHINFVKTHHRSITRQVCLDCKKKSYFANFYQEWHGWDKTCLHCGRRWSDGVWIPLDFCRTPRQDNIKAAHERWKNGLDEGVKE